jgi:CRISPR-associated protein Cmr1
MLNIRPPDRTRGWFLPPGRMGTLTLRFTGDECTLNLLAALFLFLEKWGNLGAKPQLGYGVFEVANRDKVQMRAASFSWRSIMDKLSKDPIYPDLRTFGFFRYLFQPEKSVWWTRVPGIERVALQAQPLMTMYKIVPIAPTLKNEWRFHHNWPDRDEEKQMFGTMQWRKPNEKQPKRVRSKVSLSWAYKTGKNWEVRGWVWMQKLGIASEVWNLVQDEALWQMAIPSKGSIDIHPRNEWTADEVAQFLEATK